MQLRLGLTLALSVFSLAGCNMLSINNGSLNYKKPDSTEPLKYPEGASVRPATPLYPAPIIDPLALQHAPDYENKKGNRFVMPRPGEVVPNRALSENNENYVKPIVIVDGNQNPLLKVSGKSDTIWQYTLATLSSLNYSIVSQSQTRYEATIQVDNQNYVLKLAAVGKTNTLVLFNPDNSFADQAKAKALLDQISQNWPA
ncbi:lipoprotein-34 precursor (NlpB) [Acinetobacter sp. MD2(2019)]|uniref:lipoprotein-34 precursor (NlpB) n=1 Tax=Acinetobacter sp. MD2(2019) TaxID=2605273 RepID=UPI002D1F9101|nr:lipoprotein-34 precursor (NlpB) [Acinetobacter sp. MD2(2019)]MEB3754492.1 lipoprotein-34 precursor (NlpB) [Acinetobacter sp. MD2(2019)]